MQTHQSSLTPDISVCNINSFGLNLKAQEIIEAIPEKIKKAIQSGKRRVTVMTFSVSNNFFFPRTILILCLAFRCLIIAICNFAKRQNSFIKCRTKGAEADTT